MSRDILARLNAALLPRKHTFYNLNRPESIKSFPEPCLRNRSLGRWRLCLSRFEFDVVLSANIKHQAANSQSCLQTTDTDAEPIEVNFSVAVIGTDTTDSSKLRLEKH